MFTTRYARDTSRRQAVGIRSAYKFQYSSLFKFEFHEEAAENIMTFILDPSEISSAFHGAGRIDWMVGISYPFS
jgi:hypothetical protein